MRIVLPWPSSKLRPNARARSNWSSHLSVVKAARRDAYMLSHCAGVSPEEIVALPERIPVSVTFYPPDRRKRDDDGMIGQFKPYRDGICDALGIDDHRWKTSYTVADPCKPGRIEVVIGECDEQD